MPNLKVDQISRKILSFGYCDFSAELKEHEIQVSVTIDKLPDDISICYWDNATEQIYTSSIEVEKQKKIQDLVDTDVFMPRITEDIIEILLSKNIFKKEDIPISVQQKLEERKILRSLIGE